MLQVVRALVTPSNQQAQVVAACQKAMRQTNLLQALCDILMSSGVPADILTETINAVAEVIRADRDNQNDLNQVMAPSNPPRPALVVLLMSMINEKQLLSLRCAILYCFQCYLYHNEPGQKAVIKTLLPSSESDVSSLTIGQLLCTGIFSTVDCLANWFSAVALMHALVDNTEQKEELLRVLLAAPGGHKPISLLEQCSNLLQQDRNKLQSKVGLLMLLSVWLAHCPAAVRTLLNTQGIMAFLTAQITNNEHDENEYLIQGMCAFLMGLCIQFNDNSINGQKREDICQLVIKRIGQETFCNKLSEVSRHEAYSRACKQPQIRAKTAAELLLDFEYCKMFKGLEALISKLVSGYNNADNIELTELTLSSEASALVAQYKGIIRGLDVQINSLQQALAAAESQNSKLEAQIEQLQATNIQLMDQNTLLKAQLSASQNGIVNSTAAGEPHQQVSAEALNAAHFQANLYYTDNLRLTKELATLQEKLTEQTQKASAAEDNYKKLQGDQEDLLELLTDQENKITKYKQQLKANGIAVEDDNDEEEEQADAEENDNIAVTNQTQQQQIPQYNTSPLHSNINIS